LKEMFQIRDPITAPFEDFGFIAKAFNETARQAAHEISYRESIISCMPPPT
jgi:hypothetical protein